jgi:ribokinase
MDSPTILVIGSANMDMIVKSASLPRPGETVIGGTFSMVPGGKGANQAVAAARLGGHVAFLTGLGDDEFGRLLRQTYQRESIDTAMVRTIAGAHTGVAFILVDARGENMISVASGANADFTPDRLEPLQNASLLPRWVLLQLEIPLATVEAAARWARECGSGVILDPAPAPAGGLPDSLLSCVDILTPNEVEAAALVDSEVTSLDAAVGAGRALVRRGVRDVIVTMGDRGGVGVSTSDHWTYATPEVEAVDSTAAGDCFAGALAVSLAEGRSTREAADFAARAASISVTRMGAQSSLPSREEIET